MDDSARVLLVDDHAVLRSGLRLLLQDQKEFVVVGEAPNSVAALALTEELKPDITLLDLSMPGLNGIEAIPSLLKRSADTKILVLTMHEDPQYLREALAAGASGYILKKAADTELIGALRAVLQGEVYIHSAMTRTLVEDILPATNNKAGEDSWGKLSDREQQVLRQVALGHTSQEIAELLNLSAKTIETYRARGMEKLGLKTRAALVRIALDRGLLNLD